jgi:gas vesicle protein
MNDKNDSQMATAIKSGLKGVMIGAAAGAAAVLLSDKDKRKKIVQTVNKAVKSASKRLEEVQDKADQLKEKTVKQLEDAKEEVADEISKAKRTSRSS